MSYGATSYQPKPPTLRPLTVLVRILTAADLCATSLVEACFNLYGIRGNPRAARGSTTSPAGMR